MRKAFLHNIHNTSTSIHMLAVMSYMTQITYIHSGQDLIQDKQHHAKTLSVQTVM